MAFLSHQTSFPMRPADKEPQWAVYDDLFDQYIDTEHFDLGSCNTASRSSDETSNNIQESTDSTRSSSPDAKKVSDDEFWAKTLRALEESAASVGGTEQKGRQNSPFSTKQNPHSDFLSLGGYPSPHLGSDPTSPSEAARRRKASRRKAEHPSRTPEKPVGISKAYESGSKSPKMMTPSRYRAGFRDTWAERMRHVPHTLTMNLAVRSMPLSPPSSTKIKQEFCSPRDIDTTPYRSFAYSEEQVSPFSSAFPQPVPVDTHTPRSSPLTTPGVECGAGFGDFGYEAIQNRNVFYEPGMQQRTSWNSFEPEEEYEPSPTISPWMAGEMADRKHQLAPQANMYQPTSNLQATQELETSGPMISYDPTLAPARDADDMGIFDSATVSDTTYHVTAEAHSPPSQSCTPSPPPRHRRTSSKGRTGKTSMSRRASGGGFVNYTASDKAKLLTGVAPSGSSKTKARREKEAAEKRRRFSQAAVKAVAEAGGNVTALRDVLI